MDVDVRDFVDAVVKDVPPDMVTAFSELGLTYMDKLAEELPKYAPYLDGFLDDRAASAVRRRVAMITQLRQEGFTREEAIDIAADVARSIKCDASQFAAAIKKEK